MITIDPSDYQRLGTLNYQQTLPLDDHEVVLTFDDGPLPPYSNQVLDILASQCVKAVFFLVGEMAKAYPAVARRVHDEGHTIGSHSQDHPLRFDRISDEKMRWEIDAGIDNVNAALGEAGGLAPFFRIPGFGRTDVVESELAARSLVVFSTDTVADDWHRHISPSQIIARAMSRLEAKGKGMLLLHDIHPWTVAALPGLLKALKDKGFRIVQVVPSATVPPGPIAGRSLWTVAWSMAGQTVMDDSGNGPAWPKLADSPTSGAIELPTPDEGAFDPDYALTRTASTADIEVDQPSIEAGTATSPWPYQALVAMPSSTAQLPAPSLLDIGWPVQEREIADAALEPQRRATANDVKRPERAAPRPRAARPSQRPSPRARASGRRTTRRASLADGRDGDAGALSRGKRRRVVSQSSSFGLPNRSSQTGAAERTRTSTGCPASTSS